VAEHGKLHPGQGSTSWRLASRTTHTYCCKLLGSVHAYDMWSLGRVIFPTTQSMLCVSSRAPHNSLRLSDPCSVFTVSLPTSVSDSRNGLRILQIARMCAWKYGRNDPCMVTAYDITCWNQCWIPIIQHSTQHPTRLNNVTLVHANFVSVYWCVRHSIPEYRIVYLNMITDWCVPPVTTVPSHGEVYIR